MLQKKVGGEKSDTVDGHTASDKIGS
jgi:hypothetical protein